MQELADFDAGGNTASFQRVSHRFKHHVPWTQSTPQFAVGHNLVCRDLPYTTALFGTASGES